jgi:ribonuclease J
MVNVIGAASELGYMDVPEGVLIDVSEIKRFRPEEITLVTTGSQGEPMSALYRMAYSMHDKVEMSPEDIVIISASAIPGNEKLVGNIINELYRKGVTVLSDSVAEVHVSGHACREELKIFHALTKPEFFMPIHGEARHLHIHKELAEQMGMPAYNIFVGEIGKVLEIDAKGARWAGTVPAGIVLVDGYGVGDVGNVVLRDRKILASDGIITIVTVIDRTYDEIVTGPEVISRGFVYAKESEPLIEQIRMISREALYHCLDKGVNDWAQMKFKMKEDLSKFIYSQTKRKPMILPIIMDI